jgi:multicomponent Na+:H+ antiporter subunit D
MTGTLNLGLMAERIAAVETTRPVLTALAFITVGISLKLALFPLHVWLPNAYAYAPSAATVLLASTATKVAIYLLARFLFSVFGATFVFVEEPATAVLTILSVAAIFAAATIAVAQPDAKRLFAYSSVAQIGYITLGVALASVTSLTAGLLHVVGHALTKGALFMGLGAMAWRAGATRIDDLSGIGRTMPLTTAAMVIAGLSLIGIPGTVGFVSKWYLVVAAFERGWWWLGFLVVVSSLITVLYVGRFVEAAWFREPAPAAAAASEAPLAMLVPMWLLVAATVIFGLDADRLVAAARAAAVTLLAGLR